MKILIGAVALAGLAVFAAQARGGGDAPDAGPDRTGRGAGPGLERVCPVDRRAGGAAGAPPPSNSLRRQSPTSTSSTPTGWR